MNADFISGRAVLRAAKFRWLPKTDRCNISVMASQKKELSRDEIHALRGKCKIPDDKPFAEWMADLKREEKELEERKFQQLAALGKK